MMASKRRSTRERKDPVKYFKEDSSDDEEVSDNIKAAKLKLKQMMNDDSDAESDFETEMKSGAGPAVMESSSDSDREENGVSDAEPTRVRGEGMPVNKSLCLSESDSDSEDERKVNTVASSMRGKVSDLKEKERIFFGDAHELDAEESSQKLLELAGNLERMKDVWKEKQSDGGSVNSIGDKGKKNKSNKAKSSSRKSDNENSVQKSAKPSSNSNLDSISKLLAFGEGVSEEIANTSDVDIEPATPPVPTNGVEVSIPIPEHLRKKKKKGFDVAAFLKRELSKARRELAILTHKSHLTCLVAHLLNIHTSISSSMLLGLALSIVPESHCHKPSDVTLARLGSLLAWMREAIPVNRHKVETNTPNSMTTKLTRGLESMLAMNDMELVVMFVLICRSLGMDSRLVLNCHTVPLKPTSDGEKQTKVEELANDISVAGPSSKNLDKGESSKSVRKRKHGQPTKGSDSEGEELKGKKNCKSVGSEEPLNSKLSSKLSAALKARTSTKISTATASSKNREEEMIKNIDKKYPTKQSKSKHREEPKPKSSIKSSNKSKSSSCAIDYWAEVFLTRDSKWVTVDLATGKLNCAMEMEARASKPLVYVLAINNRGKVKDVTQRYACNYLTQTRKLRVEQDWLDQTLGPFKDIDGGKEDKELAKKAGDAPLPTTVAAFKGHPLYVLQRHLLKFEAIYPATAPTLGFIKGEGVYARECVHTLLGRTAWLKEGRVVRLGEEPYKVVKARPKWDKMSGSMVKEEPLETFGLWQTELYIPPPAKDGKVPRNEYGNVELFKPWMLPVGCVQIPINGMSRVIRQTGIDAAPAMVGWDFSGRGAIPVYDGYVVCEENAEALMDAWSKEQEAKLNREEEKREKRVLQNWKRLVKGLMFREKIQMKYMKE